LAPKAEEGGQVASRAFTVEEIAAILVETSGRIDALAGSQPHTSSKPELLDVEGARHPRFRLVR
jgi:hypothetical protein